MNFFADPGTLEALKWLLIVFAIAFAMRPYLIIKKLPLWDNGFGLSFGLGTALTFLATWFISACGICPFNTVLAYFVFAVFAVAPFLYCKITKKKYDYWNKDTFKRFLIGFIIFAVIYLLAVWVIGYNPLMDETTENYMDYGFMESIYRWQQVPPEDIWFAGTNLNYYYLGQAAAVFLTRLAFTVPEYGYNLMLSTIWAGLFVMISEITFAIIINCSSTKDVKKNRIPAAIGSAVAAFSAAFAGNGYWIYDGVIKKIFCSINGTEKTNFFFSFAVSYISPDNGALDNGRTEFPAYSLILGDLHAHVVNMIFVLPLIALLLDYMKSEDQKSRRIRLVLISILLGLYKGTNFWDFAIYLVITAGTVAICSVIWNGFKLKNIVEIICSWIGILVISYISTLPFSLQFQKISSKICFCSTHTPIKMLLIIWGVPALIALLVGIWVFVSKNTNMSTAFKFGFMYLILCALGLVMSPEVVYIKDIYGDTYTRFNTMFKLTYQAYLLFAIIIGVATAILIMKINTHKYLFVGLAFIGIFTVANLAYTVDGVGDWFLYKDYEGNLIDRVGLSTSEGLKNSAVYIFDKYCADYLKDDDRDDLLILEGSGKSYSHADAVSCLSGIPTVLGWETHEWLWKDSYDMVYSRQMEIQQFYENGDQAYCQDMINRYGINYIVVGSAEYNLYNINTEGFMSLGDVVMEYDADCGHCVLIKVN